MTENTQSTQEPAHFRAVLAPYRSLSRRGFLILMSCTTAVSFVAGTAFLMIGAWPVFGFFGLDVALIYVAFKLNYRDARAYETVELDWRKLILTRVTAAGKSESVELNPYWVQVRLSERPDGRTAIWLASRGEEFMLGKCLTDDERRDFASALSRALADVRAARA